MPLFKLDFIPKMEVSPSTYLLIIFTTCLGPIIALLALEFSSRRSQARDPQGCRKLGLRTRSNLADEYDEKYFRGGPPGKTKDGLDRWRVKSLWTYPIKSCRGVELHRGSIVSLGMEHDRLFSFARFRHIPGGKKEEAEPAERWEFITQRQFPLLAKVKTEIWVPDLSSPTYSPKSKDVQSGGVLVVKFPSHQKHTGWQAVWNKVMVGLKLTTPEISFRVPFNPTSEQIKANGYPTEEMLIWKDNPQALNMSVHLPSELAQFLGVTHPLGFFRVLSGHEREVYRCAPKKAELGWQPVTGFSDAYPLHIMNLASVRDLAQKIPNEIPRLSALRFRPNIIITGPELYTEDSWKRIRIGEHEYHVACRTTRCKLPNTDQDTAEKHPQQPDKILRSYRCIDEGSGKHACLGMQMVPAFEVGSIRVGDAVEVLQTGEHYYIKQ